MPSKPLKRQSANGDLELASAETRLDELPRRQRFVLWADRVGLGHPLRRGLPWFVVGLPIIQSTGAVHGYWMIGLTLLFFVAFGVLWVLEHYKDKAAIALLVRQFAEVNSAFGGSLASFARELNEHNGALVDGECRYLCAGLLHRIRDFTAASLGPQNEQRLRATLAVPVYANELEPPTGLRVWCYDSTHGDRHWTTLHMDWPGAPEAYQTGEIRILKDVNTLREITKLPKRNFRSVVCIPIESQVDGADPLGVVNIDASGADVFDPDTFLTAVHPFVAPAIQAIGLVLQSRKPGTPYEFRK